MLELNSNWRIHASKVFMHLAASVSAFQGTPERAFAAAVIAAGEMEMEMEDGASVFAANLNGREPAYPRPRGRARPGDMNLFFYARA